MAIEKIAFHLKRRDEAPNQELARELAEKVDIAGIAEIHAGLFNQNRNIRSDCLKVLYETGYSRPDLISGFVDDFLILLDAKENRMRWGAMIALALIVGYHSEKVYGLRERIITKMKQGTLITQVWGLKLLVGLISAKEQYRNELQPILLEYAVGARPIDLPGRIEHYAPVLHFDFAVKLVEVIEKRDDLKLSQIKRINRVLKQFKCVVAESSAQA